MADEQEPMTAPSEQQPDKRIGVQVLRFGDWEDPAQPSDVEQADPAVVARALEWLRTGEGHLAEDVAAFVHGQHARLLRKVDAMTHALDQVRAQLADEGRALQPRLQQGFRLSEAYDRGYTMGRYSAIDEFAEHIQQIRDAGDAL